MSALHPPYCKMDTDIFVYGETETAYLSRKDKALGAAIAQIGKIERAVNPDLFSALCTTIVGQQISAKACQTVLGRVYAALGAITPEAVLGHSAEALQAFGMSHRKASYLRAAAQRIASGAFDLQTLHGMDDMGVCKALTAFEGVGVWTAEMLMLFSMRRPDIISFGDLAIHRGLRMLYHHREITPSLFAKYRRRYSPYASVASLYLWHIAGQPASK